MSQLLSSILLTLAIAAVLIGGPIRPSTTRPAGSPAAVVTPGLSPGVVTATPARQAAPATAHTPAFPTAAAAPIAMPAPGATPDRWIPERPPVPCPFPACLGPDGRPSSASRRAR